MIDPRARILLFFLGLAVLALAINLVRKRQLQERYALLWLLAGLVLVLAPLFVNVIDRLAARLGFGYPPALLLMLAVVGLMLIIAQLSLSISNQADRIKVLTQELGLLRTELAEMKAEVDRISHPSHAEAAEASLLHPNRDSSAQTPHWRCAVTQLKQETPVTDSTTQQLPELVVRDQVGVCGVRDDTRVLAEVAAEAAPPGRALDLGTGTGYVGLYLAQLGWQVDAVDVSPRAVDLTRANAQANGLPMTVYVSNLFDEVQGTFDVIAFNPPMRPDESETSRLLTSVLRRSPRLSHLLMLLVGDRFESNRTDFLRSVVAESRRRLNPAGRLVLAINTKEIVEVSGWPGVRLLRKLPLPGMEPQEVAEYQLEEMA